MTSSVTFEQASNNDSRTFGVSGRTALGVKLSAGHSLVGATVRTFSVIVNQDPSGAGDIKAYVIRSGYGSNDQVAESTASTLPTGTGNTTFNITFTFSSDVSILANDIIAFTNVGMTSVSSAKTSSSDIDPNAEALCVVSGTAFTFSDFVTMSGTYNNLAYKTTSTAKPTNVQDNSILVEKDTGRRYWRTPAVPYTDEDITWDSTTAVNVSISGNTATATGTSAWDKIIRSTQTWTPSDEPTLEFTIAIGGGVFNQMNGFGKGTLGSSYQTLDYALYTEATLAVYESGVSKFTDSSVTPSSSDTFKVTMDSNGLVKYWRNGSVFYTSLQTASGTYYAQFTPRTLGESTTMTYSSTTPATWTMEPTYETDFSTSKGWGMSGDKVRVDTTAGKCKFTLLASNGTDRIYQPLSRTLSDKFICEWDFLQTAISASHHYYMVSLTAGTGDPQTSTQNGIMARYTTNTANNRDISAGVKVGAGSYTNKVADDNKADYNNKIYFTMIRNVDNLRLIAYSDSTRTTVISDKNADFTETVTGLNTLILGAGSASSGGTLSAEIDNFKIYDGVISI